MIIHGSFANPGSSYCNWLHPLGGAADLSKLSAQLRRKYGKHGEHAVHKAQRAPRLWGFLRTLINLAREQNQQAAQLQLEHFCAGFSAARAGMLQSHKPPGGFDKQMQERQPLRSEQMSAGRTAPVIPGAQRPGTQQG